MEPKMRRIGGGRGSWRMNLWVHFFYKYVQEKLFFIFIRNIRVIVKVIVYE